MASPIINRPPILTGFYGAQYVLQSRITKSKKQQSCIQSQSPGDPIQQNISTSSVLNLLRP